MLEAPRREGVIDRDKRDRREAKREIKRAGHKHRRQRAKRALVESPDEAAFLEDSFGRHTSAELNGMDRDATRKRGEPAPGSAEG